MTPLLRLALVGCVVGLTGCIAPDGDASRGELIITGHCSVTGDGALPAGDAFDGDVRDMGGTPGGAWSHTHGADELVATPTSLVCRFNGARTADVSGTATYGGVSGYTYTLHVQDRTESSSLGPTETHEVVASRTYSPSRWTDGTLAFADGALVEVPASLPVTIGNAGNQWARLTFVEHETGDAIRCSYRGGASTANPTSAADVARGLSYEWVRCERVGERGCFETDASIVVGSELEIDSLELHVQHGSSRYPSRHDARTTVTLSIDVTPVVIRPSEPDYYRLLVLDAAGGVAFLSEGDLASGDIAIALLP